MLLQGYFNELTDLSGWVKPFHFLVKKKYNGKNRIIIYFVPNGLEASNNVVNELLFTKITLLGKM